MNRLLMAAANHWGGPITTGTQQYARLFASHEWDVVYLSDPISPFHLLRGKSWLYNRHKFRLWSRGGERHLNGRLLAYNHLSLLPVFNAPLLRSRLAVRRSLDLSVPRLTAKLGREGFEAPDLTWIDHLVFEGLLDRVRSGTTLYRMADEPELFPEPYPPALLAKLPRLLDRVDLVVTTARRLEDRVRLHRDHGVLYLPNGVDYEHFAGAHEEPAELRHIQGPRVLYVGSLEPWFDTELVRAAAGAHPSFQFVIIGPVRTHLDGLDRSPNVHVLGPRPYSAVAAYMAHADVGIVPFRRTARIQAVHPIKVYEYLAAGLPVVCTRWEEVQSMGAPIALTSSPAEFVHAIEAAVDAKEGQEGRRAYARANSWESRFITLNDALGVSPPR